MKGNCAYPVLESTATFLHGVGACVGGAGIVYHGVKKQWGYCLLAIFIVGFHTVSAFHHNGERRHLCTRQI
jgi:hypothetical protein